MKKILIVNDEKMIGGVSILLEDILKNIGYKDQIDLLILHNHGPRFQTLPPNIHIIYGTPFFEVVDLNIKEVIKLKKTSLLLKKIYLIFLMKTGLIKFKVKKERKKILTETYDLEIAFKDGFCSLFTAYGNSLEKIAWLHTDYSKKDYLKKYRKKFIKIFKQYDKLIAVSEPVKKNFNLIYGQQDKTFIINNYIDTTKIVEKSAEENIKLSNSKYNWISVGRLHYDKGYHRLFNTLKKLNEEKLLEDITFTLIGDGEEYQNLKNMKEEYQLQDKICMLGSQNNPFKYLKNADLFILPSIHESFGNVIIEALALKVPVLSTEVATIHEILNSKIGTITENNEEGLYNGLKKIIQNPTQLLEYKKNLQDYHYPNQKIINQILLLLEEKHETNNKKNHSR